jgi:glycosyltransferase involved in cell wall biosynthesis
MTLNLMEVIIVNDFSTDGTAELASLLDPANMRMILPEFQPNVLQKKRPWRKESVRRKEN